MRGDSGSPRWGWCRGSATLLFRQPMGSAAHPTQTLGHQKNSPDSCTFPMPPPSTVPPTGSKTPSIPNLALLPAPELAEGQSDFILPPSQGNLRSSTGQVTSAASRPSSAGISHSHTSLPCRRPAHCCSASTHSPRPTPQGRGGCCSEPLSGATS